MKVSIIGTLLNPSFHKNSKLNMKNKESQKGASLVEVILIMLILTIFAAFALVSWSGTRKFAVDDQAVKTADIFAEARQYSLNQRRIFRVELNRTKGAVTLIDENEPNNAGDDQIVKNIPFKSFVNIGTIPSNILSAPTAHSPIPVLDYVRSNYPLSPNEEKITIRFAKDGRVLDTGTDAGGTGSLMRGATIYMFSNKEKTTTPEIIRAITVLQASGDIAILKCSFDTNNKCGNWTR